MGQAGKDLRETHIIGPECEECFLPMTDPSALPLRRAFVSFSGLSSLRGAYEIVRLVPRFHAVLVTLGGSGSWMGSDRPIVLKTGSALVLPAGRVHAYRLQREPWHVLWFHLARRKPWAFLSDPRTLSLSWGECDALAFHAESWWREARSPAADAGRAAALHAELLAIGLRRILRVETAVPSEWPDRLAALWRQVDANLAQAWEVARLARVLHVSPGHLHRLVQEHEGMTPLRKVYQLRMERADLLLRQSPEPVARIAERVGYENAFAFSTAFKRWAGKAPSAVRAEEAD